MDTNTFPKKSTVTDPVCGMEINAASAAGRSDHAGESYFFCSTSCQEKFDGNPAKYVGRSAKPVVPTTAHDGGGHSCCSHAPKAETTVKDPVCGMDVDPSKAAGSFEFQGKTYAFCSKGCLEKFRADPARYLSQGPAGMAHGARTRDAPGRDAYTCPMHPEIVQEGPGNCPKCGMALEPLVPTEDDGPNHELIDMTRRFWVCLRR